MAEPPQLAVVYGEDRAVVLNLDRLGQPPVILDGIAFAIWEELRAVGDPQVVANRLSVSHGVDVDVLIADVEVAAAQLASLGLL